MLLPAPPCGFVSATPRARSLLPLASSSTAPPRDGTPSTRRVVASARAYAVGEERVIREHQATDNEHASDGRHRSRDADVSGILDLGLILTSSRTFPCAMPPPRASNGVPFPSTRGCRLLIGACNLDVVLDSRALQAAKEPPVQQLSDFSVIFGPFLAHFSAPDPPTHAMRLCSTPCPCVSDADWMLIGCRLDAGWMPVGCRLVLAI